MNKKTCINLLPRDSFHHFNNSFCFGGSEELWKFDRSGKKGRRKQPDQTYKSQFRYWKHSTKIEKREELPTPEFVFSSNREPFFGFPKPMKPEKHFPTILGLLLLVAGVAGGVILTNNGVDLRSKAGGDCKPVTIQMANVTDNSADISFLTSATCLSTLKNWQPYYPPIKVVPPKFTIFRLTISKKEQNIFLTSSAEVPTIRMPATKSPLPPNRPVPSPPPI